MKNSKLILLAIFTLTIITSCKKDKNDLQTNLNKENISGKWDVNGTNDYESFEFNHSGNYIVVKDKKTKSSNGQSIQFGTYEIIDDKTVLLSDFGNITISEINDNSISFSIQLLNDPNNEITLNASKHDEMESTPRTELMCRTWELITMDGNPVEGTEYEATVLFSEAGTYFVTWYNGDVGLSHWKWKDASETEFLYSWAEVPVWETAPSVEIPELTNYTLKMIVKSSGRVYILQPL